MNASPLPGPSSRLLIVDDEGSLMNALKNTLNDEGYAVTAVGSAREALTALNQSAYSLVLTDLLMPEMDGIALLRESLKIDPNLAVIVMTGHGSIPTAVEAMKTGAIDYVLKPFKLTTLLPVLERALAVRRLRVENAELEGRIRDRTAELEAANKELEAFSYSVSHDLRTPLRAVAGLASVLLESPGPALQDSVRRQLELIREGTDEMNRLIDDLLGFSRLGRKPLAREAVDLAGLCRDVYKDLAGERAGRRVQLRVSKLPEVQADPALLRQVVVNLLSNALKYSRPRDPAIIEIGAIPAKGGAPTVFYVRDNGVGFDMRYSDKLFGVFQRLHQDREFEGTGVGLATVRRIIEGHGGHVWADSIPDQGTTFSFTLPPARAFGT